MENRRKFPRLGTIWDMSYKTMSSEEFSTNSLSSFTVNISGGGICFEAREEIPEGAVLTIELKSKIFPSSILALGKTVWCRKDDKKDKYDVGVEFWWIGWKDKDAQQAVADYINKQIQ